MEEQGNAVGISSGDKGGRPPLRPKPAMSDILSGEKKEFKADLKPYLPQDLIGGSLPHIAGAEDNAVQDTRLRMAETPFLEKGGQQGEECKGAQLGQDLRRADRGD